MQDGFLPGYPSALFLLQNFQQPALFDLHEPFINLGIVIEILCGFNRFVMICRIEKHGGTKTVLSFLAHQYIVIHTAFTSGPELVVIRQFGVGNGLISQFRIDLHNSKACG